jgi:hypothetical protein
MNALLAKIQQARILYYNFSVAQNYLFSPATSDPVERIFSHASFQVFFYFY